MVGMLNDFLMGGYGSFGNLGNLGQQPGWSQWTPQQPPAVPGVAPPAVPGAAKAAPTTVNEAPAGPGGFMRGALGKGITDYLQNNPQTIMGFATGLLSGPGSKGALANAFASLSAGTAADKKTALDAARRKALTQLMKNPAFIEALGPEKAALLKEIGDSPDLSEAVGPGIIEQAFKVYDPSTAQQDYAFDMRDRAKRGEPSIPFSQWQNDKIKLATPGGMALSPAQTAIDTKAAELYNDWVVSGGAADTQRNIAMLGEAIQILEKNPDAVATPLNFLPEGMQAWLNDKGVTVKSRVEEVVQRNLRAVLGPAFTQIEGQQFMARAFNRDLGAAENIKRIKGLMEMISQMSEQKQAAMNYLAAKGTMQGYTGPLPNKEQVNRFADIYDSGARPEPAAPAAAPLEPGATYKVVDGKLVKQ